MFLDRLDKAILRILQVDCSLTNVELAGRVGLSPPACLKRVKRLHRENVITQQVALLNPAKLGNLIHMVVEVIMERDRRDLNNAFIRQTQLIPQVKECYQVTGEVDFVLIVDVPNMDVYNDICEQLLYSNENMKSFKTLISMNRAKYNTQLVID